MESGNLIGQKYRLKQKIGDGATCEVWEATHEQTARAVAIKLILRSTEVFRHRLLREARICGEISHRNVIEVLDAGQLDNGDPYLVMPLLQGETLAALLERQFRLDVPMAAQIGRDVARALSAAHAKSIIHRDLKPANIFLHNEPGAEGAVVKVLDFGIGKNLAVEESVATVAGGLMGSPAYMSPEQVRCDPNVDHRTDIWTLGVVLFEMLTGKRPFEGSSAQEVIGKIARGEVPKLSRLVRNVDASLEALVWHCMQVDREKRAKSAGEIAKILDGFTSAGESSRVMMELPARDGFTSPMLGGESRGSVEVSPSLGGAEVDDDDATLKFGPAHLGARGGGAAPSDARAAAVAEAQAQAWRMEAGGRDIVGERAVSVFAEQGVQGVTETLEPRYYGNVGPHGTIKLEPKETLKLEPRAGMGVFDVGVTTSVPASMAAPVAPISGPGVVSLEGGGRVSGVPISGEGRHLGTGDDERGKRLRVMLIAGVGAALLVLLVLVGGFSLLGGGSAGLDEVVEAGVVEVVEAEPVVTVTAVPVVTAAPTVTASAAGVKVPLKVPGAPQKKCTKYIKTNCIDSKSNQDPYR